MECPRIIRTCLVSLAIMVAILDALLSIPVQPAYASPQVLPVLLVHGYDAFGNAKSDWITGSWMADDLREVGHGEGWVVYASAAQTSADGVAPGIFGNAPVYALDYHGFHDAKGRLKPSAGILSMAIDVVAKDSRAADVYIIAHSQGGLMTRAVMEGLAVDPHDGSSIPYKNNIFGFMTIDAPHKGSSTNLLMRFLSGASKDMVAGSRFLKELNAIPTSIREDTFCSVAVGDALGETKGDGLFSADEQKPMDGTVPSSTEVRSFAVVHGRGMKGMDYSKYTAALDSPQVRDWASVRYLQALEEYQKPDRSPSTGANTVPARRGSGSIAGLIAVYLVSGLVWGLAYWFGLRNGRAGVRRRAAWARAVGMFLLLVVGFGAMDAPMILVSSLALPCCYLLGWNRMVRSRLGASTKNT
ncbi:MAG: hypothetical protein D9V44_08490 [Actinobacteria bacterium]|nr:MAG: hypothetical protein D9V44_08490 [Actinomycetota bacterium]